MPRGKSIDKEIKNYYEMFKDFKSDDKGELKDVYNYTNNIIEKYLKGNQELICKLCKITNIKQEDLKDMILKDAWYHIYENIYYLDIRYNIDKDIKKEKYNKEYGLKSEKESDVISLKDYMRSKKYKDKQKRRFKERIAYAQQLIEYDNCEYMYYDIPKTSSVYPDYYSVYNEENGKNYLCKQYSDIIDFFYEDKVTKGNIKYRLKNYTIWDIDKSWLPAIKDFYGAIRKGKNNLFQFQLLERLFKFKSFLYIYYNFYNDENVYDVIQYVQPFTVFGYSGCMQYILANNKTLVENDSIKECANILFSGISNTIKNVIGKIVTDIWKLKTNKEKRNLIRTLMKEVKKQENLLDEFQKFYDYDYNSFEAEKVSNENFELYKDILFSYDLYKRVYTFAYELSENKEPEENLFEDDEDDNGDDADKEYLNNVYKGKIAEFFASIEPDGCNGDEENDHDENYEEDEDGGDKEDEDEHVLMYDISNNIEDPIYDFDFSKLLSLITEKQYNEFLQDDEKENNKDEDDDDDDDEDEHYII